MILQSAQLRRCASCQRWQGIRAPGGRAGTVLLLRPEKAGVCIDGPWHRTRRRIDAACGHWLKWQALD